MLVALNSMTLLFDVLNAGNRQVSIELKLPDGSSSAPLAGNLIQYHRDIVSVCSCCKMLTTRTDAFNARMTNVLVSRFILDLRAVHYKVGGDETSSRLASSVQFATSAIVGNLGAPIYPDSATWAVGAGDEAEEGGEQQEEAEDPIAFGLPDVDSSSNPA